MPKEAIAENVRIEDLDVDEVGLPDFESSEQVLKSVRVIYDFTCPECEQRFENIKAVSDVERLEVFWSENPVQCGPAHKRKGEVISIPLIGPNLVDLL